MRRPRFQFSIRSIFAWTAAVAAWVALWVADPASESPLWLGAIMIVASLAFPPLCGVACFQAKGATTAFWFGTLFVLTVSTSGYLCHLVSNIWGGGAMTGELDDVEAILSYAAYERRLILIFAAISPFVGLICMTFHWFLDRSKPTENS
jgi:hypothetical protein